ncbi:MAG: hypothetical protein GY865_13045 [candidate division Zixibacteria bacterium]|nr:hypothetical protein [candidate division Zixibacteria bacterium]
MLSVFEIDIQQTCPCESDILKAQGIPSNIKPEPKIIELAQKSISIYNQLAKPKALIKEISVEQFEVIYFGDGRNDDDTPLEDIYKLSNKLALFAVSIGEDICQKISELFEQNDYALASMLDSAASEGVENTTISVEQSCAINWETNNSDSFEVVTRFSPGYCGWHISGQKKLFDLISPETIGIKLSENFLMEPIKSISGVLIAGKKEIFDFSDNYSFCADCADHSCQKRDFSYPENKI